jgi:hypothetical protein
MTTKTLSKSDLAQFTGSESWYRHAVNRNVLYTDGAQHVAEQRMSWSAGHPPQRRYSCPATFLP